MLTVPMIKERGQGLVEYALILVLISIAVIIFLVAFGVEVNNAFDEVVQEFQNL